MAAPSSSISFLDPTAAIAQQQAAQQQAMADELRAQSMQSVQQRSVGGIAGRESPMEGIAKLAQAIAANHVQRNANQMQYAGQMRQVGMGVAAEGGDPSPYVNAPNPYASDPNAHRTGMQQIGDFLRGGPPINTGQPAASPASAPQAAPPADMPPQGGQPPQASPPALATALAAHMQSSTPPQAAPSALAAAWTRSQQSGQPPQASPIGLSLAESREAALSAPYTPMPTQGSTAADGTAPPPPASPSALGAAVAAYGKPRGSGALPASVDQPPQGSPSALAAAWTRSQPQGAQPFAPPQGGVPAATPPAASLYIPNMSPIRAFMLHQSDPDLYNKLAEANLTPTDFAKQLQQSGIDPRSPLGLQMMQTQVAKLNNVPDEQGRPGGVVRNGVTHQITGVNPQSLPGGNPVIANGQFTGDYTPAGGATQIEAGMAAAGSRGKAEGQAPYDVVQVTGPDGRTYAVPKSSIPGFGGPSPGGAPGGPAPSGGLNGYYAQQPGPAATPGPGGMGAATSLAPGVAAASNTAGSNSADQFTSVVNAGSTARQATFKLQHIADVLKNVNTGPGAESYSETKGVINTLGQPLLDAMGLKNRTMLPNADLAPIQEARKSVSDLALSLSASTGGARGATDARLQTALSAITDPEKAPQAIANLTPILKSYQSAALAKSQAASMWQQAHGPQDYANFERTWQQADSPEIFYQRELGPKSFAKWANGMLPQQRAQTLSQYQKLKGLGAFGAAQ